MGKTKKATNTDVLINLVLDKSGSMSSLGDATCTGVNSFFDEQRNTEGKALLSLTLFDTDFDVRYVGVDLAEVPALGSDKNHYTPSGMTALYDAVVTTIKGAEQWLRNHPSFDGRVVFIINTDGGENSSVTHQGAQGLAEVNRLITAKTGEGWEFVFMGAGQAAWTEGTNFSSIPAANFRNYDSDVDSVMANYAGASNALSTSRISGAAYTSH